MVVDARNFDISHANYYVVGSNGTHEKLAKADSQIEGVIPCRYAPAMAKTNTLENMTKLEMESNGTRVEVRISIGNTLFTAKFQIPFKMARYTAPKPVIICISPQFVAEQWQIFIMHVHVANRFGGHLHIYLSSIIDSYFELMKEYEKQGYVTIDFWRRMKFAHSETPIKKQQNTLHSSIWMMYTSYLEEFDSEWTIQPNASSIVFKRREHEFVKAEYLSEFSMHDIISSLKSSRTIKAGKVIVKPHLYNSTWIHDSQHEDPKMRHRVGITTLIHVQRPLQKHSENNMTRLWQVKFGPLMVKFRPEDIRAIEEDIWRIRNISKVTKIAKRLPNTDFYLPIVFKCYYDVLYGPSNVEHTGIHSCPNAESCFMPQREDYKCIHSDAQYFSGPHMVPFTYHFSNNSFWSKDIGCYQ
ncbi:hypothetical protein CRE_30593 [Caenorhabditis remanei]|uniref:Glycosyltransferase family 92 protein n=2 Tax=Caenorhabditis remanei TaxID=31234 RepID=E3NS07_CAERE|nr:hypothetical protein CRE_30593 [Caenorhabditis remanei]